MRRSDDEDVSATTTVITSGWSPFEVEVGTATLSGHRRVGDGPNLLFLHGLGSSSDDITGAAAQAELSGYRIEALDLPGHRLSRWRSAPDTDAVQACVEMLEQFVADHVSGQLAIVGHSVGGAIGVLLADRLGTQCRGFINVEGNLIASDCGSLSRPTAARDDWRRDELFDMIDEHLTSNPLGGTQEFLDQYRGNIADHQEWVAYTSALMRHSADRLLLDRFVALRCWRSYIYGGDDPPEATEQLAVLGVPTTAIAGSGHWPMYARPSEFFRAVAHDLRRAFGA
jgi:pimeloyl-ACP methyl ester carboxylesterase